VEVHLIAVSILMVLIFIVLSGSCLILVIMGLPGTWFMVLLAFIFEYLDRWLLPHHDGVSSFGLPVLVICLLLAGLGEFFEFLAGAMGAKKFGASRRGMIGAVLGGLVGALFGVMIPIPVLGSILGALGGTFLGALIGEMGRSHAPYQDAFKPAAGATLGRILGILSKFPIAMSVWIILSVKLIFSAFFP
jgi:uncharacterized protein YqgC (DUF456 family)